MNHDTTRGNTVPEQGETQERVPRAPHERDQSADQQGSREPSARSVGAQAHEDLKDGLQDTSKQPELEKAYDKLRRDGGAAPPAGDDPSPDLKRRR